MASEKIRLARRYYRRLGPYRLVFTGSIVCMAMVGLLEPLLPLMLKPLLDGEAGGGAVFTHLPWLMIGVVAARCAFAFGRGYSTAWVESQMLRDLRGDMAAILPRLPAARYAAESGGDFIARMMPFASHTASSLTLVVVALVQDSIKTLFYAASLFFLQWQLALIVFSVSPIVIFAVRKLNRRIKKISQVDQALLARGQNIINETAASWRLIKAGGGEEAARARLAGLFARMRGTMLRIRTAVSAGQPLTQFILAAAFSLVLFYIVSALQTGEMSAGDAGAFLAVMLAMQAPARSIVGALAAWEQGTVAAREVFNFLDSAVEDESGADIGRARGETVFAEVGFSYPGAETPALSGLSFSLAAGEHVALVGESGAGKTSAVNLLLRFYDPQEGAIFLDGVDIRKISRRSLRRQIGYVTQEARLFDDTIAANVAYGADGAADPEKIQAALRAAAAADFVAALPQREETTVGEGGDSLSGGQRQRILIARAFYRDCPLVILDEASAALDAQTEAKIKEAISRLLRGRTAIIVAHRFSMIDFVDRAIVMENGRAAAAGAPSALLETSPLFRRLYEAQKSRLETAQP